MHIHFSKYSGKPKFGIHFEWAWANIDHLYPYSPISECSIFNISTQFFYFPI
jgi:hypothetical protein